MKRTIYIVTFLILYLLLPGQNPNNWDTAWVNSYGGPNIDIGRDVKETADKGFILVGSTSTFGQGSTSIYLIKTDSIGKHEWSNTYGNSNADLAYSIEIAQDSGYFISGTTNNLSTGYDAYLIKTNKAGVFQWSKTYGGGDWDFVYDACSMPDGGLILCGETFSDTHGGSDAYLVRVNANGDTLWTKKIGDAQNQAFLAIERSSDRIFVAGRSTDAVTQKTVAILYKLDYNGNTLNNGSFHPVASQHFEYHSLFLKQNGELLLCGKRNNDTSNYSVLRTVDTTNLTELYYVTTNQPFFFRSIIEATNGDVYTIGPNPNSGQGGMSAEFVRYNNLYYYISSANFGGPKDEDGYKILKTSKGFAFVGSTTSYGNSNKSVDENVYFVIFNRHALVNDYFLITNEFQDNLSWVGITDNYLSSGDLLLYPNPATSDFKLKLGSGAISQQNLCFELFNSVGELVSKDYFSGTETTIQRKGLTNGLYFYRLTSATGSLGSGKIVFE